MPPSAISKRNFAVQPRVAIVDAGGNTVTNYAATPFTLAINRHAATAPVLVAVVSQRGSALAWVGNQVQGTVFRLVDIGISCEHFVLQAHELGLGTCWLGWFNAKAAARLLAVPRGHRIEMLLSVGYPAETPQARPRRSLAEMSAFNGFAGPLGP